MPPTIWFDYQVENFDPAPDEELICSICRCVFFDPVECPCRHVFCKKCIMQWLNLHKSCPACRKRISKSTLQEVVPIIKNMIMKLTLLCRNSERGCKAKCTVELYESHLRSCSYELIGCKNGNCESVFMRMHKEIHEDTECLFRSATCEICKLSVVFFTRQSHDCVRALMSTLQDKDVKIAELQQENDNLKHEMENYKKEREKSKISLDTSSEIGSVTSISVSVSSNDEDSDLDDYSVRIFSVVHPTDSFSMSASVVNESQNGDSNILSISRTDFIPMDSTNYTIDSPKSSSSDYLDSDLLSLDLSSSLRESAEQALGGHSVSVAGSFALSPRRSLKRRISNSSENAPSLNQSTRSNPPCSPLDNFWDPRRSRMAYSDTETPQTSASATASGNQGARLVNETIEILDSYAEDADSSDAYPNLPSSSYVASETSQGSNPHASASGSGGGSMRYFQDRYRSRLHKQRGFRGLRGKSHHVDDKNSASNVPRSRVPLAVANPGSSSTPVFSDRRMSYGSVGNRSSPEALDERRSNRSALSTGLKKTLSLLARYADKESDPDWVPSNDCPEESDTNSAASCSSKEKSPILGEDLSYFSPIFEQERECDSSDSSSGNSESWATDISETDSSYEVEVPPSAWDLLQRFCDEEDSEDDSEWFPAPGSNA